MRLSVVIAGSSSPIEFFYGIIDIENKEGDSNILTRQMAGACLVEDHKSFVEAMTMGIERCVVLSKALE